VSKGKTIAEVVKSGLCTGCGTCAGICPVDAIEMGIDLKKGIYIPQLDEEKCNQCGLCFEVCPGRAVDFKQLNLEIFGKEPDDILIGNYLNCYIGHAIDYNIRYNSSSGGLVTALLIYALEQGIIDGALVTRMKKGNPLEPEPFIARTSDEIIEAAKSKYCPVPANIALKEILKAKDEEKFAVVGLPCHIHGIRKAETDSKRLKEKIALYLGLFCNHVPNFWGTRLLLHKLEVNDGKILKLDYRGEGWPGYMKISKGDGEILLLLPDYWSFVGSHFFFPSRCLMCDDATNELADISFGDAWLPRLSNDKIGTSLVIARNEIGEGVLQEMKSKNEVELSKVSANEVIQSQRGVLYLKKNINARQGLFKAMPYNMRNSSLKSNIIDRLLALFPYLNSCVGSKAIFRKILPHIPSKLIWLYGIPYVLLSSTKAKKVFMTF
jgi:coenzyme F420 hydrogenase subunit beta